ncbi:MAG: PEP-CTERM sorting domain-containing protein [Phycisphaerae bacterium]
MRLSRMNVCIAGAAMVVALPGLAMAGERPIVSFSFSDLDGSFSIVESAESGVQSGLFTAADDNNTTGDVTRVRGAQPTDTTAVFAGDLGGFPGLASFDMHLPVDSPSQASAESLGGSLALTDIDGDSLAATVTGGWERLGTFGALFVGLLTDVQINRDGNSIFEGADGQGFSMMGLPAEQDLEGTVVALAVPGWFVDETGALQEFQGANVGSIGAIVPEPLSLSLLAAGGVLVTLRRKRRMS